MMCVSTCRAQTLVAAPGDTPRSNIPFLLVRCALQVLEALAVAKPAVAAAEVRKVQERFRARHYCDRVLAACSASSSVSA
jgi:hypothetical protein